MFSSDELLDNGFGDNRLGLLVRIRERAFVPVLIQTSMRNILARRGHSTFGVLGHHAERSELSVRKYRYRVADEYPMTRAISGTVNRRSS